MRLLSLVRHSIHAYGVLPQQLVFEVTESALMTDPARFIDIVQALHDMGCRVAIDDFGTGYSSMVYLQQIKADEVKIDLRFVRNIHESKTNQSIVQAIIQLANATDASTVAEGIECEAELQLLQQLGCPCAQGYYWSPPLPAADFAERYLPEADSNKR